MKISQTKIETKEKISKSNADIQSSNLTNLLDWLSPCDEPIFLILIGIVLFWGQIQQKWRQCKICGNGQLCWTNLKHGGLLSNISGDTYWAVPTKEFLLCFSGPPSAFWSKWKWPQCYRNILQVIRELLSWQNSRKYFIIRSSVLNTNALFLSLLWKTTIQQSLPFSIFHYKLLVIYLLFQVSV